MWRRREGLREGSCEGYRHVGAPGCAAAWRQRALSIMPRARPISTIIPATTAATCALTLSRSGSGSRAREGASQVTTRSSALTSGPSRSSGLRDGAAMRDGTSGPRTQPAPWRRQLCLDRRGSATCPCREVRGVSDDSTVRTECRSADVTGVLSIERSVSTARPSREIMPATRSASAPAGTSSEVTSMRPSTSRGLGDGMSAYGSVRIVVPKTGKVTR